MQTMLSNVILAGNGLALAILAYLAIEVRRDVRETRDRVLVMWEWYQTIVERRQHREDS